MNCNIIRRMLSCARNIEYRVMEPYDFDQVVELTAQAFSTKGVMQSSMNFTPTDVSIYLYTLKQHLLAKPLSLVAVEGNRVVGSRLCDDYNEVFDDSACQTMNSKYIHIRKLLKHIRIELIDQRVIPSEVGLIYHLFMGAIHQDYAGQGIIRMISMKNEELALRLKYKYALSESASPITQHIYSTLGYKCIYFYPYSQLKHELPDQTIEEYKLKEQFKDGVSPGIRVMLKQLIQ